MLFIFSKPRCLNGLNKVFYTKPNGKPFKNNMSIDLFKDKKTPKFLLDSCWLKSFAQPNNP